MSELKLKPCPFCGNFDLWVGYNSPGIAVRCRCGIQHATNARTDEEAAKAWNKRS